MERGFGPGNLKMAANFWMSELLHWLVNFECLQQGLIKSDKMFYSIVFQIMLGIVMCKPSAEINMSKKLPRVVDYRDTHFSTPIKEQRECGACWAFAPTEVMEAMRFGFRSAKVEKIAKSLSVQHLIDCSGVSYGCKGGDVCDAMDYLIATDYQFVLEADYLPYSAVKHSTCQRQVTPSANITIGQSTCEDFSKSEDSLLSFIAYHGPVVASVDATVWKDYLGGIIRYNCDAGPKNHAVVIAGYNLTHSPPYYIVRNSWGRSFGDNGYMYIATGRNLCGIADKITLLYPKYN